MLQTGLRVTFTENQAYYSRRAGPNITRMLQSVLMSVVAVNSVLACHVGHMRFSIFIVYVLVEGAVFIQEYSVHIAHCTK
jgi:hypothetical protein